MNNRRVLFLLTGILLSVIVQAQHEGHAAGHKTVSGLEPQPLLAQAMRLKEGLSFLGSSLSPQDEKRLDELKDKPMNQETIKVIQEILDPYCLAIVDINPEARVKVMRGSASPQLIQAGWKSFLVKVINAAGSTAEL